MFTVIVMIMVITWAICQILEEFGVKDRFKSTKKDGE